MDFYEWIESEEISAKSYRWYISSCGLSSKDNAIQASKNAFAAGEAEGMKQATTKIIKKLTE